jgi:hypothetical protein
VRHIEQSNWNGVQVKRPCHAKAQSEDLIKDSSNLWWDGTYKEYNI